MKKKTIKVLDLDVYETKLKNGLEVYIIPNNKVNNTYCTYTTRYGGIHNEFMYNNKMIEVPKGIAHFLEHKMFEQEDGTDTFKFFSERGSDANANTNARKTTYLFSGPNKFYENLEFLLSYVEKPYFTDENVEKEKGIILEELEMYQDNPYRRMISTLLYNTFINDPMKYPTIGTRESVKSITKEQLYTCYNTFYHPSNMYLVITGNVDKDKCIEVIRKHENKRKLGIQDNIVLKEYKEPKKVEKEFEEVKMDVTIPKFGIAFKIDIKGMTEEEKNKLYSMLVTIIDLKISSTSLFNEKLRNDNLITSELEIGGTISDTYLVIHVLGEAKEPKRVIDLVLNEIKDLTISKKDFTRSKKMGISNLIYLSDNIFRVNSRIVNEILTKKEINYNPVKLIKSYKYDEVMEKVNSIDLSNKTICIINPIK